MIRSALLAVLALAVALGGGAAGAWAWLDWPERDAPGWAPAGVPSGPVLERPFALPLGGNEGVAYAATLDAGGNPLRAACDYRVAGRFPSPLLWTLAAVDRAVPAAAVSEIQSLETMQDEDGLDTVTVSPRPSPGNWLAVGAKDRFTLILSLYGGAVGDGTGFTEMSLPRIETVRCDE